ncbi:MAG: DUF2284 domain-containing protein [Blautia sp.]
MEIKGFDTFIANYPVFEYRQIQTADLHFEPRVRTICQQECERYGTTWACPPAVGDLEECRKRCLAYPEGIFFSTVAEVSDVLNMEEMLSTRREHERITNEIGAYLKAQGLDIFILSTESCDICEQCTYPNGPCRHPQRMHPCLESHGVVVSQIVEEQQMEYQLGGNTILWFSLILIR